IRRSGLTLTANLRLRAMDCTPSVRHRNWRHVGWARDWASSFWTILDPGCVKSPRAPKPREWPSQIGSRWTALKKLLLLKLRSEEICSISFSRRLVFTQPRPKPVIRWASFYHLVGACEQRGRHGEAQRFRGLEIDHQFNLSSCIASASQ